MATNPSLSYWSELASDVLLLVYERLSFADFARAMTVCSSWYYVLRSSRRNNVPWLIFKQNKTWNLFNPDEGKFYKTHISRQLDPEGCHSVASCGRWVLVIDNEVNLPTIFNPFTSEIIHLPPLYLYTSKVYKILDNCPIYFDYVTGQRRWVDVRKAVLWVDEITKDYLVVCQSHGCNRNFLYFCMKGNEEWTETSKCEYLGHDWCVDMAYKDKKLYILSDNATITILDFSQRFPIEVPNHPYVNKPFVSYRVCAGSTRMKLTTSGDIVLMIYDYPSKFQVFKMNNNEEWEIVDSLEEDEAFFWDLSVTLPTEGVSGIKKNSIYFCDYYREDNYSWQEGYHKIAWFEGVRTYDIPTQRIERFGELDLCGAKDVRWMLPCFGKGLANRDKVDTIHGPIQVPSLKGAWTKKLNFATFSLQ